MTSSSYREVLASMYLGGIYQTTFGNQQSRVYETRHLKGCLCNPAFRFVGDRFEEFVRCIALG